MCDLCNQGGLGYGPDGDRAFCDCVEGVKAALEASCRLINLYSDQLAVFDRLAPLPPKMLAMRDEIWIAYNLECLARDDLHGGGKVGGDTMTYICRPCSAQHDIPRREDRPEVGICPICQDVHALYLVKREPEPDAGPWVLNIEQPAPDPSPWVLVEDALPESGELVNVAYKSGNIAPLLRIGWVDDQGSWYVKAWRRPPDLWCPIPPLPSPEEA